MYFIQNINALRDEKVKRQVIEFEVIADGRTVGEFNYGPYFFTIWEFSNKPEGEKRKLCLRIIEKGYDSER